MALKILFQTNLTAAQLTTNAINNLITSGVPTGKTWLVSRGFIQGDIYDNATPKLRICHVRNGGSPDTTNNTNRIGEYSVPATSAMVDTSDIFPDGIEGMVLEAGDNIAVYSSNGIDGGNITFTFYGQEI